MFLKRYGVFGMLYDRNSPKPITYQAMIKPSRVGLLWISNFWLSWGNGIMSGRGEVELRRLQLSQLWRFYILERIDTLHLNDDDKATLIRLIKYDIENNGWRELQEIREKYKKHFGRELLY